METFAKRLSERARQLRISNAEAARRSGLDERRYAYYVAGRSEPDLTTLKTIAIALQTNPNWLLGFVTTAEADPKFAGMLQRFENAANGMTERELEICVIQAEAVAALNK